MSKAQEILIEAYNIGYRVTERGVVHIKGDILKQFQSHGTNGYLRFHMKSEHLPKRRRYAIMTHRLGGYQKFGEKIFEKDQEVRHLDGNMLNNKLENLGIGTHSENMRDRSKKDLKEHAIKAASKLRTRSDDEVKNIRDDYGRGLGYKALMEKYNISSKATLHYILNDANY